MRARVVAWCALAALVGAGVARADANPAAAPVSPPPAPTPVPDVPPAPPPDVPLAPPPKADDTQAPARVDPVQLDRASKRAKLTRNIGLGLGLGGIALSVAGAVLIGSGATSPFVFDEIDRIIAGVTCAGVGLVIGVPGIYFWAAGQDDMDSVVWRRRQMLISSPR